MRKTFSHNKASASTFIIMLFFFSNTFFAQEIKWENVSISVDASYLVPQGDWGKYWGNSFGVGGTLEYNITDLFAVQCGISFSPFTETSDNSIYPEIFYFGIPLALRTSLPITKNISICPVIGFKSNTFMFEIDNEQGLDENTTESEFGILLQMGLKTDLLFNRNIDLYFGYQAILSTPEFLGVFDFGIRVFVLQ